MKKIVLAALAATTSLVGAPAFAQFGSGSTDTTTITATVALICTIDAPLGGAVAVNGTTAIGNSAAQCNDPDGFTATLTSANAGKLVSSDSTSTVPYTLNIDRVGSVNLANPAVLPRAPGDQEAVDGFALATSVVTGAVSGPAFAGAYSDTITYSIVPN